MPIPLKLSRLLALACASAAVAQADISTPLEFHQLDTFWNLQSQQGMPISAVSNSPAGSDGRAPAGLNESGTYNLVTSNQFQGVLSFAAAPAATNWRAVSNSALLKGNYAFSASVATAMQRPCARSNGAVALVLRRAQVGALYIARQVDCAFGSSFEVPFTDESGVILSNVVKTTYWDAEPYTTTGHTNSGYYWSPHAGKAFAIQAGPIAITWRKQAPYTAATVPTNYVNAYGSSFETNGSSIYLLYTVSYVASGSAAQTPRRMYWTEKNFRLTGKPVLVPANRVGGVEIVYNNNFPRTVDTEYRGPGYTSPAEGSTNATLQELRTLWYDPGLGSIQAYNFEGRVFVEILGDMKPDGLSRQHLGFEIVDVVKQPFPTDLSTELGERLLPPDPLDLDVLFPEPLVTGTALTYAYAQYRAGSDVPILYATRETVNNNDYSIYWMYGGVAGLRWPEQFARYRLFWPTDEAKYSHYLRTLVASEDEAQATAVALSSQNVPSIEYQDPLDQPRAKLTDDFKFYTFLDAAHPAQRTLLRFVSGEAVAFERVYSWLDSMIKGTNFIGSVATNLDSVKAFYDYPAAAAKYSNYLADWATYQTAYGAYSNYLVQSSNYTNQLALYTAYTNWQAKTTAYASYVAASNTWVSQSTAYTNYLTASAVWRVNNTAYTNYVAVSNTWVSQSTAYTNYLNASNLWRGNYTSYTNYVAASNTWYAQYVPYTNYLTASNTWWGKYNGYTNYTAYTNQLALYTAYTNWLARYIPYSNYVAISSFQTDFTSLPAQASIYGNASVTAGSLHLTEGNYSQAGSFLLPSLTNYGKLTNLTVTFTLRIWDYTSYSPADGFSFYFGTVSNNSLSLPSEGAEGLTNGLSVCFDSYDNDGLDDAPAISIKLNGVQKAAVAMAGVDFYPNSGSVLPIPTDPATGQPMTILTAGAFSAVQIVLRSDGTMDVYYKNVKVLNNIATGYAARTGRFGMTAATGGLYAAHWIDDLSISANVGLGPTNPGSAPTYASYPGAAPSLVTDPGAAPTPVTNPGAAPTPVTNPGSAPTPVTNPGAAPTPVTNPGSAPVVVSNPGSAPTPVANPGSAPTYATNPGAAPTLVPYPGYPPTVVAAPGTKLFDNDLTAPRVVTATAYVGDRIIAPTGEIGQIGPSYLAAYVNQAAGISFDPTAYLDPFAAGFAAANSGAVIAVNAIPGTNTLEVWWYRTNSNSAGLNAGNGRLGFATVYWPSALGRYTIQWPVNPREIVLASKLGSGTLDTFEAQGIIYRQNDSTLPGYNPNEEHALMAGGMAFATRDDLNLTNVAHYSSHPFVLVRYTAGDGRPAISAFKVLREKPSAGYVFDYIVPAGQILQAPMPLPLLAKPVEGSGDNAYNYNTEPTHEGGDLPGGWNSNFAASDLYGHYDSFTWRDRHDDFWVYRGAHSGLPVLQAGAYATTTKTFRSLTNGTAIVGTDFTCSLHASRQDEYLALTSVETLPDWLSISGLTLGGTPMTNDLGTNRLTLVVEDLYDHTRVTNLFTLAVKLSGSVVRQAPLALSCTNLYTGTVVVFSNRSPFLAVSPTSSNSFTMRYYYKTEADFDWPGVANPPPAGSIVPYLRPINSGTGAYVGDAASRDTVSLEIVYRPVWPERDPSDGTKAVPTLAFGGTVITPKFNLPGVRDMLTAQILYQQSVASNLNTARPSVVLHDPTREKSSDLAAQNLKALPGGIAATLYQGLDYFALLPPHLATRLFMDPNRGAKGQLVLRGEFVEEDLGESYLMPNLLRGTDLALVKALCPAADSDKSKWDALVDSLATAVETFRENPNVPGTYIPNPNQTVSVGVGSLAEVENANTAVDSYALSATGPGSGYVTLVEASGAAFTKVGDPVALHIFKVGGSQLYLGEVKVIPAPNPLSEQVAFQHSVDVAGRYDEFEYEWRIAQPVDGMPPLSDDTMSRYLSLANGTNLPRQIIGGAGILALCDNYVVMRYRAKSTNHPLYNLWSDWTEPKLAEGWIKRVLAGINPFNQRITDLFNNPVNTDSSILTQAGKRWEGDVALNLSTMNNYGLIEIYETVLRRGRMLSIESGYNYGPANDALLLAAGYLNDLYMMLGNEAWADAANPTIGIGTKDKTYGDIATALFAFKGQVGSLLDEELGLLRGRDDFLMPGVRVPPVYNRLIWNYTRGIDAGEVIYALNYNIQPRPDNSTGSIGAADAAHMFPQGHGDAYGHYLTALKGYYSLLLNSYFDWVPRIEAINVLGQAVSVDYQDERKFAAAAVALARAGRQVFDLTWREDYTPVSSAGWKHFGASRTNSQRTYLATGGVTNSSTRYWSMDHWATRTSQGAFLNWIVGNSILPDVDLAYEGIQHIDRTTVPELTELATTAEGLQTALDNAEGGLSPLGVPEGGIAFDINPAVVVGTDNGTHFEQIYTRAKTALANAVASFDDAKDVTRLMRSEQDSLTDFQAQVNQQELAYTHSLIELYGTPYADDIGVGKTWAQGYTGPDLLHYSYVDSVQATFGSLLVPNQPVTFKVDIQTYTTNYLNGKKDRFDFLVKAYNNDKNYLANQQYVNFTLDAQGSFLKPATWQGQRVSPGKIQEAIGQVLLARNSAQEALTKNADLKYRLDRLAETFQAQMDFRTEQQTTETKAAELALYVDLAKYAGKMLILAKDTFIGSMEDVVKATTEALPQSLIVGVAAGGDTLSAARGAMLAAGAATKAGLTGANFAKELVLGLLDVNSANQGRLRQLALNGKLHTLDNQKEVYELDVALSELQLSLFGINQKAQELDDAFRRYRAAVAEGDRLQEERQIFRQRSAALIQGYRTRDAAFRIFRNEKLERYKTLFDLAARYALLSANAYDYETGLLDTSAGRSFKTRIINSRALGVVRNGEPQYAGSDTGDPGLSSTLAEMKADWDVLRGRLGFNNPDAYGTAASLRTEASRILPTSDGDANWKDVLQSARVLNLLDDADVRRACMQIDDGSGLPVPGIILTFSTTIADGYNLFGKELAAGDHAFTPSAFATKIFGVGIALEGYRGMDNPTSTSGSGGTSPSDPNLWYLDPLALSATPYVYLIPVGVDSMRSPPLGDTTTIRTWTVEDVAIPMPFNIGASDFSTKQLWQSSDSLTEPQFATRKHQAFRPVSSTSVFSQSLYGDSGTLKRSQFTNNRLVGRSVWNSQWKLVIPGKTLLNDPNQGLDRFIQTVTDIKLHFVTYSYSGN